MFSFSTYDRYFDEAGADGGAIFVVLMYVITIIVAYIYQEPYKKQNENANFFFNMTFVSLMIYILRYFMVLVERISYYYQFAFLVLLPNVIESIPDKRTKNFIRGSALFFACSLLAYRCIRSNYGFKFFWQ